MDQLTVISGENASDIVRVAARALTGRLPELDYALICGNARFEREIAAASQAARLPCATVRQLREGTAPHAAQTIETTAVFLEAGESALSDPMPRMILTRGHPLVFCLRSETQDELFLRLDRFFADNVPWPSAHGKFEILFRRDDVADRYLLWRKWNRLSRTA